MQIAMGVKPMAIRFRGSACLSVVLRRDSKNLKENTMNTNKLISLAILAGGIVLVIFGVTTTNSFSSDVSRFFTDSHSDKAIWMFMCGIVAIVIGLSGLTLGKHIGKPKVIRMRR
jgi:hypothetical protein